MVRELRLKNGLNFRDLGGYRTSDNRTVRWHLLLRGGYLSELTALEQEQLYRYGVRTVIDLRTSAEVAKYPDRYPAAVNYIRIPVSEVGLTGNNNIDPSLVLSSWTGSGYDIMMRIYRCLVLDSLAQKGYACFLRTLVKTGKQGGTLFHCSTGKDRTGFAAILLLSLLGVPESTIKADYLLTNRLLMPWVDQRLAEAQSQHLGKSYLVSLFDISTVNSDYYDQLIALINYEFGGMRYYLTDQLGIDQETIDCLQNIYLE